MLLLFVIFVSLFFLWISFKYWNFRLILFKAKRLEALMVEEEALRESLSKMERLRMLKRVIADIKDDFKTEKKEQESGPPKLTSVNLIAINNLIREKAIEMQLRKTEVT